MSVQAMKRFLASWIMLMTFIWAAYPTLAVDDVAGTLLTLTNTSTAPNGAWSWFEDERVIIDDADPNNSLLLLSSVSAGSSAESGDIDLLWRNLDSGVQGEFELNNQLQQDDHDSAALYLRPDGRYLAMYSQHGSDSLTRWRISIDPHDPASWGPEQSNDNGAGTTYDNTYYLPQDNGGAGRTYNFTRADNYDPVVQISNDDGSTWSKAGKLLTEGGGGDRPYVRYASDGKKIHFITTERHPRNYANSVYHGYVQDGVLYNTAGEVIDGNLFDDNGVAPASLTPVFENGSQFDGLTMNRAWTINLEIDSTGNPVGIITARVNDSNQDHRFLYARYDGTEWHVNQLAEAGAYLYAAEDDYTGLASIDPDNPNVVYMSSDVDPRDSSSTGKYELYKGFTSDFGENWTWTAITENSTVDNIRPVVPQWNGKETAVAWMRGNYNNYSDWDTEIVALNLAATDPKSLLWRGDGGNPNAWDVNVNANWDSGGDVKDVYLEGAEVAFDDSASTYAVNLSASVTPSNVAFNNSTNAYTVTGSGIGGSGGLRVLGGGMVTLANGSNTYTGNTTIARGTLALFDTASLTASPQINVKADGKLNVNAVSGGSYTLNNQTLTVDGDVTGNIVATNNSKVHVNSTNSMNGNLTIQSGSFVDGAGRITGKLTTVNGTVQVGGSGLSTLVHVGGLIDDFDGYDNSGGTALGTTPNNLTGDVWVGVFNGTGAAHIVDKSGSDQAAGVHGVDNGWRGMVTDLSNNFDSDFSLPDGETATYFFQFNPTTTVEFGTGGFDCMMGLSDDVSNIDINNAWQDFAVMPFFVGAGDGSADLKATGPSGDMEIISNATLDTWYNIWLVVDNDAKTYDVYTSTGTSDGTLGLANAVYRNGLGTGALEAFGFMQGTDKGNGILFDNLYVKSGEDTSNPLATDWNEIIVDNGGETLTVDGDFELQAGATLSLDAVAPNAHDQLVVGGNFTAGGTLQVVLDAKAPALKAGDVLDVLDVTGTKSGAFATLNLPRLSAGLVWNVSKLMFTGELQVVSDVDLDDDGRVTASDFLLIQRSDPSLIAEWQRQYGSRVVESTGVAPAVEAVPEPTSVLLMLGGGLAVLTRHR